MTGILRTRFTAGKAGIDRFCITQIFSQAGPVVHAVVLGVANTINEAAVLFDLS